MPRPFPGVNGDPATGLPSFVVTEGLPVDWSHYVTLSRALSIAIDAATFIPTAATPELVEAHFVRIDQAKTVCNNTLATIEAIESWSRQNLLPEPEPTPTTPHHESSRRHPFTRSRGSS